MKKSLILCALLGSVAPAFAHDYTAGELMVYHPHILAPMPGAKAAGGYVEIHNTGEEADRLIAVETAIAAKVELHNVETDASGVTRMIHMVDGIEIGPDEMITLEQGGQHIMMMGLTADLIEGEKVPAVFIFEKAGRFEVDFAIDPRTEGAVAAPTPNDSQPEDAPAHQH